jgi:hypothetical protein
MHRIRCFCRSAGFQALAKEELVEQVNVTGAGEGHEFRHDNGQQDQLRGRQNEIIELAVGECGKGQE